MAKKSALKSALQQRLAQSTERASNPPSAPPAPAKKPVAASTTNPAANANAKIGKAKQTVKPGKRAPAPAAAKVAAKASITAAATAAVTGKPTGAKPTAPPAKKQRPATASTAAAPSANNKKKAAAKPKPAPEEPLDPSLWEDASDDSDNDSVSSAERVDDSVDESQELVTPAMALTPKLTQLQQQMQRKLEGSQFRWLNEQLYTIAGKEALELMSQQPHLFDLYHRGFRAQAEQWPENPVHRIAKEVATFTKAPATIVDLGCGDALVAQRLGPEGYTVRSFDLVAKPPLVEAADMAAVPMKDSTADVVIFSLSLMNTNWGKGAAEGARILRKGGIMKIAEVVSRIPNLDEFIACLEVLGLQVMSKDTSNTMFVFLTLRKKTALRPGAGAFEPLKPCIYKRR